MRRPLAYESFDGTDPVEGLRQSLLIPQGPSLAPTADIQLGVFGDGIVNPERFCPESPGAPEETPDEVVAEGDVALFHHTATVAMADELCRLAREFKRRVNARELLPALTALSALAPLHAILVQQFVTRLMAESTTSPNPPSPTKTHETSPVGYL